LSLFPHTDPNAKNANNIQYPAVLRQVVKALKNASTVPLELIKPISSQRSRLDFTYSQNKSQIL